MPFAPVERQGTLHHFTSRLVAFEHSTRGSKAEAPACNFVLFLGGLGDGLLTVRYPAALAEHLPAHWSVAEVLLSSSYTGWTTSTLARDADEVARAVRYFRDVAASRKKQQSQQQPVTDTGRIVLLGHSTGANISMEYLAGPRLAHTVLQSTLDRPFVDGVVLQAGVSDRQGVIKALSKPVVEEGLALARQWVRDGRGRDVLPAEVSRGVFGASPSAQRWVSLVGGAKDVEGEGGDDYFSSDLPDDDVVRAFGREGVAGRRTTLQVLMSAEDEFMPAFVDKEALLSTWRNAVVESGGQWDDDSGVLPGAGHNLNRSDPAVVKDLCERVVRFVARLESRKSTGGDGTGGMAEKL